MIVPEVRDATVWSQTLKTSLVENPYLQSGSKLGSPHRAS
jgi:hypothetical protein